MEIVLNNNKHILNICFQVMIQRHNHHMSISYYISVLAVTDTVALLVGKKAVLIMSSRCGTPLFITVIRWVGSISYIQYMWHFHVYHCY